MRNSLFIFCFLLFACNSSKNPKASEQFIDLMIKKKNLDDVNLNFSGFYNKDIQENALISEVIVSQGKYFSENPFFFFRNGLIFSLVGQASDSGGFSRGILKYPPTTKYGNRNWGTYDVNRDTINAMIFCQLSRNDNAQLYAYRECHFQGLIKDSVTIVDWKLIPPYPIYSERFDKGLIDDFINPSVLKFKKFPVKDSIDSNSVWVNDYRYK